MSDVQLLSVESQALALRHTVCRGFVSVWAADMRDTTDVWPDHLTPDVLSIEAIPKTGGLFDRWCDCDRPADG